MDKAKINYRELLFTTLNQRKSVNSRYSIRAFARDLGVSKTLLADILADKANIGKKVKGKIIDHLRLSPALVTKLEEEASDYFEINDDQFQVISDWHYFAILSLSKTPEARYCEKWVSERLGIDKLLARNSLTRLERMSLIQNKNGKLKRTSNPIITIEDIPSSALRNHHTQNFDRAKISLEKTDVELRDISSVTMPIDPKKIGMAKEMIRDFRKKLNKKLESKNSTEVYTLAVQLFPQTNLENNYEN